MKRGWKRTRVGAAWMLAVPVAIYAYSCFSGPTPAQERALAMMSSALPAPAGSDAFVDVWTWRVQADAAQRRRIAEADVARFNAHPDLSIEPPGQAPGPLEGPAALMCRPREPGCLAHVRAEMPMLSGLLREQADTLARTRDVLEQHTHLSNPFVLSQNTPFLINPPLHGMRLWLTQAALDFAQGRHADGLAATCRMVAGWERWLRHPDLAIDQMVGVAYLQGAMQLQAEMLAELPRDFPAPASCAVMRQLPDWQKQSLCRVSKREFQYMDALSRDESAAEQLGQADANLWQRALQTLFYRRDATRALLAERMAYGCGAAIDKALRLDEPIAQPPDQVSNRVQCIANFLGCALIASESPLQDYQRRVQDVLARRRLMAVLWQLRDDGLSGLPMPERLRALPAPLQTGRDITPVDRGLQVTLFVPMEQERDWRVPIPGTAAIR